MRAIKVRAWIIPEKRMVRLVGFELLPEGSYYGRNLHLFTDKTSWNALPHRPDDVTLLLFTGLHDKHDKEIWDGDVVRFMVQKYGGEEQIVERLVQWDDYRAGFTTTQDGDEDGEYLCDDSKMEVLGNIYDNPELCNPKEEK